MSLHPSLKIDSASSQQRSVLTRIERIKDLMKKGLWTDGRQVTALPKTKVVKIKAAKAAPKAEGEAAAGAAAAPAAGAAKPAAKAAEKPAKK
jgi:small basic protein (TIGR04137 family)